MVCGWNQWRCWFPISVRSSVGWKMKIFWYLIAAELRDVFLVLTCRRRDRLVNVRSRGSSQGRWDGSVGERQSLRIDWKAGLEVNDTRRKSKVLCSRLDLTGDVPTQVDAAEMDERRDKRCSRDGRTSRWKSAEMDERRVKRCSRDGWTARCEKSRLAVSWGEEAVSGHWRK